MAPGVARNHVALVGLKCEQGAGIGLDRLAAGLDPRAPSTTTMIRVLFLDLMVAQLSAQG